MKAAKNRILALLSEEDRTRFASFLEPVLLSQGQILHESLQPIEYVYFLERGFSSEIALDAGGARIEVGCIGNEGFAGIPAILGVTSSPHRSFMETDGAALRIRSPQVVQAMRASESLASLLLRYVHVFMIQVASTVLADGRYGIQERTARWLLMSQDRMEDDDLPLTHQFLSLMLGVRRASVTDALHTLEGEGAIKATRGHIHVRSRKKLEAIAGYSYGLPEAEYERVMMRS
jgi:CRP-like cAMP-binding protein